MSRIHLPRIDVPTFDGNLLNRRKFLEEFETTIHNKTQFTSSYKLTYLRKALKDGPARLVVSGLTMTLENYTEVTMCLQERYGQELRRLRDLLLEHTREPKASGQDTLDVYVTAAIDLKLDEDTKLK